MYKIGVSFNKPVAYFNLWKCLVINKFQPELQNNLSSIISYDKFKLNKSVKILINAILTSNNNFMLTNASTVNKNKHIHAFYKLLTIS